MTATFSPAARRDAAQIRAHIARDDPRTAAEVARKLDKAIVLLAANPRIGRPVADNVREWSIPGLPFIIPYRIDDADILILRIFHTSRERPRSWQ